MTDGNEEKSGKIVNRIKGLIEKPIEEIDKKEKPPTKEVNVEVL